LIGYDYTNHFNIPLNTYQDIMIKMREDKRYLKKVMVIRDKLILILFVGVILTSIFTSIGSANILGCMESPKIWYVDDDLQDYPGADFAKIQDAVNAASAGDTIIVYSGTYYENVLLNKTITLMGKGMPTVDANDIAITIDADDCKVEGFRCVNSFCGIKLWHDSSNNTISNNTIRDGRDDGIGLWNCSNNTISNNTYEKCRTGIFLYEFANNNIISKNICKNNK